MTENRNTILAIILSGLVLLAWQYFYNVPQMEKQRASQVAQSQTTKPAQESGVTIRLDSVGQAFIGQRSKRPTLF